MLDPSPKRNEDAVPPFLYQIINSISLPKPVLHEVNFWDVVARRKSSRNFKAISLDTLSLILWASAKVKSAVTLHSGYILTSRPSASAGARHPIDILVLTTTLTHFQTLYYYNPFEHSLNQLAADSSEIDTFVNYVDHIVPVGDGTIVWFIAHPQRTEAKYSNPLSLIWRDAGALIHSIQLVCTAIEIESCSVGGLGELLLTKMLRDGDSLISTGGLVIG